MKTPETQHNWRPFVTGDMKIRTVRISDDLWQQGKAKAKRQGVGISTVIRRLLYEWLKTP